MKGFKIANLALLVEEAGEEKVKLILSGFACPLNQDVECFLHRNAIEFAKQGIAATHLVFASYQEELVLVGYFTLANKFFTVPKPSKLSNNLRSRLTRFGNFNQDLNRYEISAPLIAQLGKNFASGYNSLITGAELLKMACDEIRKVQLSISGKIAYVECEDKPALKEFYTKHGFVEFNTRQLDRDEQDTMEGKCLVQMLIYFGKKS